MRQGYLTASLVLALATPSWAIDSNNPKQAAGAVAVAASQLPPAPPNGEMGFVFSDFSYAVLFGMKENCPDGWALTIREQYLAAQSPAERARLLKAENEPELTQKWKASAILPDRRNVCSDYDKFPEKPLLATVQNKVAYGLNLDGDRTDDPYVCAHETFTSPSGEPGIDNQAYRAQGCTRQWRGPDGGFAEMVAAYRQNMARGEFSVVLLVRGIDSMVKDDSVEVVLASAEDTPIIDSTQNYISGASYSVSKRPEWRNVLRGRIENGELTTEPKDVVLKHQFTEGQPKRAGAEFDIHRARLRLHFQADGSLEGTMGGYEKLFHYMYQKVGGGAGTINNAGINCASVWNTLTKLADGERDPVTGQCRRISSAFNVIATPAFIFDKPPESPKTASAE